MFIKEIHESDIGIKDAAQHDWSNTSVRLVVRGIIMNADNRIALISHEKL